VFYLLLSIVEQSMATEETSFSTLYISRLNPLLNNLKYEQPSEKRAHTHVPEHKRLLLYSFGLGKRWIDNSENKVSPGRNKTFHFPNIAFPLKEI